MTRALFAIQLESERMMLLAEWELQGLPRQPTRTQVKGPAYARLRRLMRRLDSLRVEHEAAYLSARFCQHCGVPLVDGDNAKFFRSRGHVYMRRLCAGCFSQHERARRQRMKIRTPDAGAMRAKRFRLKQKDLRSRDAKIAPTTQIPSSAPQKSGGFAP